MSRKNSWQKFPFRKTLLKVYHSSHINGCESWQKKQIDKSITCLSTLMIIMDHKLRSSEIWFDHNCWHLLSSLFLRIKDFYSVHFYTILMLLYSFKTILYFFPRLQIFILCSTYWRTSSSFCCSLNMGTLWLMLNWTWYVWLSSSLIFWLHLASMVFFSWFSWNSWRLYLWKYELEKVFLS